MWFIGRSRPVPGDTAGARSCPGATRGSGLQRPGQARPRRRLPASLMGMCGRRRTCPLCRLRPGAAGQRGAPSGTPKRPRAPRPLPAAAPWAEGSRKALSAPSRGAAALPPPVGTARVRRGGRGCGGAAGGAGRQPGGAGRGAASRARPRREAPPGVAPRRRAPAAGAPRRVVRARPARRGRRISQHSAGGPAPAPTPRRGRGAASGAGRCPRPGAAAAAGR